MHSAPTVHGEVAVERWHTEIPLFVLIGLISAGVWLLLTITIIGLAYALLIGAFFFVAHAAFVAHIKGSAVRVGPEQFPDLLAAVQRLSERVGLKEPPDAYIMESGGALNALAMRFMRSKMIVLYSDLLDACGEDLAARDMIIAHELGHIRAGHLRWQWVLLPGMMIPFLGTAYSRAREFTCDRYGLAGAGDHEGALHGLTILAAGGKMGRLVNRRAFVRQRNDLNTGWMTIGKWLSTHPPLAERIAALDPALRAEWQTSVAGPIRALAIMIGVPTTVTVVVFGAIVMGGQLLGPLGERLLRNAGASALASSAAGQTSTEAELDALLRGATPASASSAPGRPEDVAANTARAEQEMQGLVRVIERERRENRRIPSDWNALIIACRAQQACGDMPTDPFDGAAYGYTGTDTHYLMFSSGPDGDSETDDDIVYDSRLGRFTRGWEAVAPR